MSFPYAHIDDKYQIGDRVAAGDDLAFVISVGKGKDRIILEYQDEPLDQAVAQWDEKNKKYAVIIGRNKGQYLFR